MTNFVCLLQSYSKYDLMKYIKFFSKPGSTYFTEARTEVNLQSHAKSTFDALQQYGRALE